jgi:hypothetical protein
MADSSQCWNDTTKTLTLTGAASLANYQTLLGELTSQDTGIDTSAGSHPIRDVTWTISDGAFSSSAASEGGMREQKITLGDMRQSGESHSPGRQSETATSLHSKRKVKLRPSARDSPGLQTEPK